MANEGFGYLVGCYFHQDWVLTSADGTPSGVLEVFIRDETIGTVAEVRADLAELLTTVETDPEADELLARLGSSYRPAIRDESSRAWLHQILARLERENEPTTHGLADRAVPDACP